MAKDTEGSLMKVIAIAAVTMKEIERIILSLGMRKEDEEKHIII